MLGGEGGIGSGITCLSNGVVDVPPFWLLARTSPQVKHLCDPQVRGGESCCIRQRGHPTSGMDMQVAFFSLHAGYLINVVNRQWPTHGPYIFPVAPFGDYLNPSPLTSPSVVRLTNGIPWCTNIQLVRESDSTLLLSLAMADGVPCWRRACLGEYLKTYTS